MPAPARRACANCGASMRARDRFCSSCGTPFDTTVARTERAAPASASLQVAGHAATVLGEQRKVVTILFADLSGSTPLGERLDPEELRAILTSYFNELARQIKRYEGTIDKYVGDAVMAVFGAPISHEDDAERAINAALAMQASIGRLNEDLERRNGVRLSLRVGVNTGEVVAGLLAGDVQAAYTVVGDAVNTAQRFEAAAPPGEVLVSATTRRLAIHSFEFEQTAPLTLKGKAERVVAYRVLRRRYEEIAPEATPFIGRGREVELLRGAVADAVEGRGSVINVVGEAGVGKSRLVGELRAGLVSGIDRITVRCASFETNTPYALVADFVRGAFSIHAADDEEIARTAIAGGFATLGHPLDDTIVVLLLDVLGYGQRSSFDPETKRRVLVDVLRALLRLAGGRAPFVLTAEDLHWVDAASLRVLEELAPIIPSLPAVFVTTSRPGWRSPWPSRSLALAALDEADARSLVEAVFEVPVDDDLARAVYARTAGNPFFLEEVVRELQASNLLIERTGKVALRPDVTLRVPETVQEVLEARLDRLPDPSRRVLQIGAVCGRTFWSRVVDRLAPELDARTELARLEREGLITLRSVTPEITYGFAQMLIQEVAYQTQLQSDRRRMHGAVARAVEDLYADRLDEFVDFLAYHYSRADDDAQAYRWLVRAGDRAEALFANQEALAAYAQALPRARDRSDAAAALERTGDVQLVIGAFDEAIATFRKAREQAVATAATDARLHRKIGLAYRMKGAYDDAEGELAAALAALAGAAEPAESARIHVQIGQLRYRRGEHGAARDPLSRAIELAQGAGEEEVVGEALRTLGLVSAAMGDLQSAVECYQRCRAIYERTQDLQALGDVRANLGSVLRRMRRFDDALAEHAASLAVHERTGHLWAQAVCHNNIGEVHRSRGAPREAIPSFERALAICESIGARAEAAATLMNLGAAHVEAGAVAEGRRELLEAESRFAALGSTTYLIGLNRYLASAELAGGDLREARRRAERSLDLARGASARHQQAMAQRVLAEIAIAGGNDRTARALLEESRRALTELGEIAELGRTEAVLAGLGAR